MTKTVRIAVAILLTLAVFGGLMFAFIYTVFRFDYGYVEWKVFYTVASVLFACSVFLVNVGWQAMCNRYFTGNRKHTAR